MRKYISNLHNRPDHHKNRFALLASGTITLFIFGIWSLTTFGMKTEVVAEGKANEVSPFQSLRMNLASGIDAFQGSFSELKSGFKPVDVESEYRQMREVVPDNYGQ